MVRRIHVARQRQSFPVSRIKFDKNDMRRVSDRRILSGELEITIHLVHAKYGHVVSSLVTAVQKVAIWIEAEAARVVASSPYFFDIRKLTIVTDCKDPDAVVKPVADIDKTSVVRYENLGAKIASLITRRQGRQSLS